MTISRERAGFVPLLLLSAAVITVAAGLSKGVWLSNLHNGLLGLSFICVGAYVLHQCPQNRCGWAFLATGTVESIMFLGRQIGHDPTAESSAWWGWVGVWPLVVGVALVTWSVIVFPDGRLPAPWWRWVVGVGATLTFAIALVSMIWPLGYESAGVATPPPFTGPGAGPGADMWSASTRTVFALFQVVWLVAVVDRWRRSGSTVRRQLAFVGASVLVSLVALAVGLVGWGSPVAGLLATSLVPVAAGWAIVHRQRLATRSVLDWLLGRSGDPAALPDDLAAAIVQALDSDQVVVWARRDGLFHAVGASPTPIEPMVPVAEFGLDEAASRALTVRRLIGRDSLVVGALTVRRGDPLTRHDEVLLDGLCSQAALVLEHMDVVASATGSPTPARLERLTPRENDVLALMARGLTNAAICDELHLSIKTVEPLISSIFSKLGLAPGTQSNRRVLAVRAHIESQRSVGAGDTTA